jgi:hypothetical protein
MVFLLAAIPFFPFHPSFHPLFLLPGGPFLLTAPAAGRASSHRTPPPVVHHWFCNARVFTLFKLQYKSLAKNNFQNFSVVRIGSILDPYRSKHPSTFRRLTSDIDRQPFSFLDPRDVPRAQLHARDRRRESRRRSPFPSRVASHARDLAANPADAGPSPLLPFFSPASLFSPFFFFPFSFLLSCSFLRSPARAAQHRAELGAGHHHHHRPLSIDDATGTA